MDRAEEEDTYGTALYTPAPGFRGLDSFQYQWE
jgi:hypothetical protein